MLNEEQIGEVWTMFNEFIDKKNVDVAAEQFVDLLAEYGVSDSVLENAIGVDDDLDEAITYYLELDSDTQEDDWDE